MLIACDAFKIGDGIRIIGRRIALCYITLRYIEKRRIQTAQIPVDRGIVTFNEKITVHATADDVAVIRRARHCHPDQLAARALAFPTTFDIHPIHVTRRICPRGRLKPRTRNHPSLALLDSPPAVAYMKVPLAGGGANGGGGG